MTAQFQTDDDAMTAPATPRLREQLLAQARTFPFFNLIGLEILAIEPRRSTVRVAWRPDLAGPGGLLHGGITAALIDTGTAYALLLCDELRDTLRAGGSLVTIDLRIKYLRPVSAGAITCTSRVTRMGRQIIHMEAVVTNAADKEVARGDAIYTTVTPERLSARGESPASHETGEAPVS